MSKIRVLVVDDSTLVRHLLSTALSKEPGIEIVGLAGDPYQARDILVRERPDVITLDVEMPKMDGVTFLRKFMPVLPTPTLVLSSLTGAGSQLAVEALEAGALEVLAKPQVGLAEGLSGMMAEIIEKIKSIAGVDVRRLMKQKAARFAPVPVESNIRFKTTDKVIAIGSSTGGVEALRRIIPWFPSTAPGIVIVQHMPAGFTTSFAKNLNALSAMEVREACDGDRVRDGLVLVAPGGERHMLLERSGAKYQVRLAPGERVSGHRPSVDELFESVSQVAGANAVGVLMTGMGRDGAKGLASIRQARGRTLAQDEQTSVVFGMPGAAWEMGAAEELAPLQNIPGRVLAFLGETENVGAGTGGGGARKQEKTTNR